MKYLLDTNICISFLSGKDKKLRDELLSKDPQECCLCSVVKAELSYGARKSKHVEENLKKLVEFFQPMDSLPFDDIAAEYYGSIRSQLEREGKPIGANDLIIAAIALSKNLILVTRNQTEFLRVPGLRIESW